MTIAFQNLPEAQIIASVPDSDALGKTGMSRRINICFLIDNLQVAGTENHLLALIRELDRSLFNPLLVLFDGENETSRQLEPDDCPVIRLGIRSFFRPSIFFHACQFIRCLRRNKIDIVQMHFPDSTLFGTVCGRLGGVRNLIRTRRNAGYWMTWIHQFRCRVISRLVNKTIVNNEASRTSVIEQERAPADSVVTIPNGVELVRYHPRVDSRADSMNRRKRVGMLANLRPVKGIEDFIYAAAAICCSRDDCDFVVAGDGPQKQALGDLISKLQLSEQIQLTGMIQDVPGYLSSLDVLVTCSSSEGLSNSILEGMACGLPIIATDIEGNRSVVEHRRNGLLFPVGDVASLVKCIGEILDFENEARNFGLAGRKLVENSYDQATVVLRYQELYLEMADKAHL